MNRSLPRTLALALACLLAAPALVRAEASRDRFSAAGYFRIMARPDFEGGWSRLGLWNLSGRLLNEGPWGALELKLDVLPPEPGSDAVWTSVHAKLEGGSVRGADQHNGSLSQFGLSQLYVKAGNVLFPDVIWQLGTLHTYFGDLGLYDMRPAELFWETLGLSALWQHPVVEVLVGFGDAGYPVRGSAYSTVLSVGGSVKLKPAQGLEIGLGGQFFYEPEVEGNRNGPHRTVLPAGIGYEEYWRGEVVETFDDLFPGQLDQFPKPEPVPGLAFKAVAYLGFGGWGFFRWNNLYVNFLRQLPDSVRTESFQGVDYHIYLHDLTDQRYQINAGDELQLTLVPGWLDLTAACLVGYHWNADNSVAAGEDNRLYWSVVGRFQLYLTDTLHWLTESSFAQERSLNGNLWRGHHDSIFQSQDGIADQRGLQFGDLDQRDTWQLKAGLVLNPTGQGIFTRPSIRLLYGLQWSNMHNAFGNSFVESLDQYDEFPESEDRRWHSVISLEAEAWF
ncbi:MAG TPA: hypothetical protein PK668_05710 [Myxococcota bacterium]|nr:hypothetical protein [Myxococcota bacterium]HRY92664.1 hypothetical protein [Myxococcota bacterium]HSA21557.1 hypothetical protein [Myxococcota bacterium]